ncbi:hypothetical protein OH799_01405 [Nocardia sp. NBC_00881]|uniref:hypothetical protein n=1 Tax=Nocardia sp. NBC_00881 TaxID=2975995 RepID=UPI003866B38F|nr:hypothetical protein OH799_01405 [Nocardia sp. NBC_00881]
MPAAGSKRSPRSPRTPEVRARLERSRERVRARRAQARHREQAITSAVKQYIAGWQAITECENKRDNEIEALREQIRAVQARAAERIAGYRAEQALAAATIRDQGQTDDDVAELLEIDTKQAQQLINTARTNNGQTLPSASPKPTATPTAQPKEARSGAANPVREQGVGQVSAPLDTVGPVVPGRSGEASSDEST